MWFEIFLICFRRPLIRQCVLHNSRLQLHILSLQIAIFTTCWLSINRTKVLRFLNLLLVVRVDQTLVCLRMLWIIFYLFQQLEMTTHTLLHKTIILILWKRFGLNTVILFSFDMGCRKLANIMTDLNSVCGFMSTVCIRCLADHLLH